MSNPPFELRHRRIIPHGLIVGKGLNQASIHPQDTPCLHGVSAKLAIATNSIASDLSTLPTIHMILNVFMT